MNINPKKSWHVRSKQNLARVRRDEAEAEKQEKEKKRKIDLAESEARSDLLRKLASKKFVSENGQIEEKKLCHVNFFEDLEAGEKVAKHNKQHEEEEKKKKEKMEMDIGLLTYLGQGSSEFDAKLPWYLESQKKLDKEEVQKKSKLSLDPLNKMNNFLEMTEKYENKKKGIDVKYKEPRIPKKKHEGKKSLQQMREDRLARERKERLKVEKMFRGEEPKTTDLRKMSYNSRFNPELPRYR